jgi:hypothetical protein
MMMLGDGTKHTKTPIPDVSSAGVAPDTPKDRSARVIKTQPGTVDQKLFGACW